MERGLGGEDVRGFLATAGLEIPVDYAIKVQILSHDGSDLWIIVSGDALYSFNTKSLTYKRWFDLSNIEPRYLATASDGILYFSTNLGNPSVAGYGSLAQEKLYRFVPETTELMDKPKQFRLISGRVEACLNPTL
jgi:hypothetical protein